MTSKERHAWRRKRNMMAKQLREKKYQQKIESPKNEYHRMRKQDIEKFLEEESDSLD